MLPFGIAIFWGAFLLFLVQPLIAKFILPWFGGSAAVWTTCMLFFQAVLLAGYAGAHWLVTRFPPRKQVLIYLGALVVSLLFLPIHPSDAWKPVDGAMPAGRILLLLAATLGLPYLVLSMTGPLMQAWFARAFVGISPYRLYAVSNVGSLLALVSYPLFFERYLTRGLQAVIWSVGLGVFAILAALCGRIVWNRAVELPAETPSEGTLEETAASQRWLWFALPACASVLLLAVTNKICQDMAVIPFLWVLPLIVYLLSFIISFDSPKWYWRPVWIPGFALALLATLWVMLSDKVPKPTLASLQWLDQIYWRPSWMLAIALVLLAILWVVLSEKLPKPIQAWLKWLDYIFWLLGIALALRALLWVMLSDKMAKPTQAGLQFLGDVLRQGELLSLPAAIGIYIAALFVCCMVCHGEVYRVRPAPRRLSGYYLLISAGGAFGGFAVAVVAPLAFHDYVELNVGLVLAAVLVAAVLFLDPKSWLYRGRPSWAFVLVLIGVIGTAYGAYADEAFRMKNAIEMSRSFFGMLKVYEEAPTNPSEHKLLLQHGSTDHGSQFVAPEKRAKPTAYYVPGSGVGRAMQAIRHEGGRRIAVVGLGTGTMASYGEPGDYFRFYEIDRNVQRLAHSRFSYLDQSKAKIEIAFGDARLSMERESDEPFDMIVLDAFSGDAIPVHLLTREAVEIYLRRLKPSGIIAVHISNRYLDLQPVVVAVAEYYKLERALVSLSQDTATPIDESSGYYNSDWILLSRDRKLLGKPEILEGESDFDPDSRGAKMWTDDWSNLLPILRVD